MILFKILAVVCGLGMLYFVIRMFAAHFAGDPSLHRWRILAIITLIAAVACTIGGWAGQ